MGFISNILTNVQPTLMWSIWEKIDEKGSDIITWFLNELYSFSFSLFGINISSNIYNSVRSMINVTNFLLPKSDGSTSEFYDTLGQYVEGINSTVCSVAISLLCLFFLINLIKMATQDGIENISWTRIVVRGIVFFILLALINRSMWLFQSIAYLVQHLLYTPIKQALILTAGGDEEYKILITNLKEFSIGDDLAQICIEQGGVTKYLSFVVFVLMFIPYIGTIMMVLSQVFLRMLKILIYTMFAPLPIALAAEGEVYRGKSVSFIMNFAGVCFESVIIYIGLFIYCLGLNGLMQAEEGEANYNLSVISVAFAVMFMNALFSALISLSSQLSERFFSRG